MRKLLLAWLSVVVMTNTTCAQQEQTMSNTKSNQKTLVVYFSATGTTANVARMLADATGGELCRINPAEPYTSADLDWNDRRSRSSVEMDDPKSRPAIQVTNTDIDNYDVVFIGYPIWWDLAPRVVNTFIESTDLRNKIVIPFATSGGSSITNSVSTLKATYPDLKWKDGRLFNHPDMQAIRKWIDQLGF